MPIAIPDPDHEEHLQEQGPDQRSRARADRPQQRERPGLLQRDDEEEEPDDQRYDQAVQQEDHDERPAHLRDARRLRRRVVSGQGFELGAQPVDSSDELFGAHARRGHQPQRVRERLPRRPGSRRAPPAPRSRSGRTPWGWPGGSCCSTGRRCESSSRRARPARRLRARSPADASVSFATPSPPRSGVTTGDQILWCAEAAPLVADDRGRRDRAAGPDAQGALPDLPGGGDAVDRADLRLELGRDRAAL